MPFATFAGKPSTISIGTVSSEPLPAIVFTKPAAKPKTGTLASRRKLESKTALSGLPHGTRTIRDTAGPARNGAGAPASQSLC